MLNLFRNKLVSNLVWVVVFATLILVLQWLWQPPIPAVYYTSPLVGGWLDALHHLPNGIYISAAIVFVASLIIGFVLNYLVNRHEVLYRQTYLPALFCFYFSHLFAGQHLLSPHFLAVIFILLIIYKYLLLDGNKLKTTPFLDMGFFSGMAFCLSPDTVFFVPALLLALISSAYISFKTFMLYVTGFSIPLYFIGLGYFLAGKWAVYTTLFSTDIFTTDIMRLTTDPFHLAVLCIAALILLLSLAGLRENYMKNTIRARKSQQMLVFFLLSAVAVVLFSKTPLYQSFSLVALPLSPFISYYFLKTKKGWFKEMLFSVFFLIVIIAVLVKYYT